MLGKVYLQIYKEGPLFYGTYHSYPMPKLHYRILLTSEPKYLRSTVECQM